MKKFLIFLIRLYQKIPGKWHFSCKYVPTCSNYAIEAINTYGVFKGGYLTIKRILRCVPWAKGGYDPVPLKRRKLMKRVKLFILVSLLVFVSICSSGCSSRSMKNIDVLVTNYPNEFVAQQLYGEYSTVTSIYPDGVDISEYKINNKQKKDFSNYDLFIYNGLIEKERDLAVDLLDLNPNLKIIDTAYVLETDYSPEELWLNPSSLLMMAQNVRLGLEEYIDSNVLKTEIDLAYDELKVDLSEIHANYRIAVENTNNKTIVVANSSLKYLEKFGLNVYCIDTDATDKTISEVQTLIDEKKVDYIYSFVEEDLNAIAKNLIDNNDRVSIVELHRLDNITDEERKNKDDYLSIIENNLELIKKEIY